MPLNDTALLVMDMQLGILERFPGANPLVAKVSSAIAYARVRQMPIIYAVIGFRKGAPEVSPNNKSLSSRKAGFDDSNPIYSKVR